MRTRPVVSTHCPRSLGQLPANLWRVAGGSVLRPTTFRLRFVRPASAPAKVVAPVISTDCPGSAAWGKSRAKPLWFPRHHECKVALPTGIITKHDALEPHRFAGVFRGQFKELVEVCNLGLWRRLPGCGGHRHCSSQTAANEKSQHDGPCPGNSHSPGRASIY